MPAKCEFYILTVSFLGHIVRKNFLKMDPSKVSTVTEWPVSTTPNQLQRFLGFANFYRRFICSLSMVAALLTALTSVKTPFQWMPTAEGPFNSLKHIYTSAPILQTLAPLVRE